MEHGTNGSDSRPCGQKDGVRRRFFQYEAALRPIGTHLHPFVEFAEPGGCRSLTATPDANLKAIIFPRRGRNGIRRWHKTARNRHLEANGLPRQEFQSFLAVHSKCQMMSAGGEGNGFNQRGIQSRARMFLSCCCNGMRIHADLSARRVRKTTRTLNEFELCDFRVAFCNSENALILKIERVTSTKFIT